MATQETAAATQNTVRFLVEFFIHHYDGEYEQVDQSWLTREYIARKLGTQEWKVTKRGQIWYKQYRDVYDVEITDKTWVTTPGEEAEIEAKCNPKQAKADEADEPIELFTEAEMEELREVHSEQFSETHGCEWDFE